MQGDHCSQIAPGLASLSSRALMGNRSWTRVRTRTRVLASTARGSFTVITTRGPAKHGVGMRGAAQTCIPSEKTIA